jgi:membrane protein required for colicin V production
MLGPLTYLDAGLLVIALLSGLLAMYRGFAREVLSILSWVIALAAVAYVVLFQEGIAKDLATQVGVQLPIAKVALGGVVFLIVLIVVHLVTSRISDSILDSRIGMIDRVLGFVFGVARGLVLVVIPFMFFEEFVPEAKGGQPVWVAKAKTLPLIRGTGNEFKKLLVRYVPNSLGTAKDGQQG